MSNVPIYSEKPIALSYKKITKIGPELTFLEHFEIRPDFRDFPFLQKVTS